MSLTSCPSRRKGTPATTRTSPGDTPLVTMTRLPWIPRMVTGVLRTVDVSASYRKYVSVLAFDPGQQCLQGNEVAARLSLVDEIQLQLGRHAGSEPVRRR